MQSNQGLSVERVGDKSGQTTSNFDVRLLPMKDIFASAPLEALIEWFHVLSSEMYQRQSERKGLSDWTYSFQYALIGPPGVGKTNLRLMFTENVFRVSTQATKGVEFSRAFVQLDQERVKLQMWDTNWGEYTSSYLKGAAVVFFVFDVTCRESYKKLTDWLEEQQVSKSDTIATKVLIGNKVDVMGREVPSEEAALFARQRGLLFMETSAKTGQNVKEAFHNSARQVLLQLQMGAIEPGENMKGVRLSAPKDGACQIVQDRGSSLLRNAVANKSEAFSLSEREELGLNGLLPPCVLDIETQAERCYQQFKQKASDVEKYIYLEGLHDRNETLYYRLLVNHIEEMMPIVYTPVVGKACQLFGYLYRSARGLYFNLSEKGNFKQLVWNCPIKNAQIIVVTDGSRILGLGDLGTNGMGIPIGKLALYVACAGIHPGATLPVTLDVGTNNKQLLEDPLYLGQRNPRVDGEEFYALVEEFVDAVKSRWPDVLIQFEDFSNDKAFPLLHNYQEKMLCFNDDIQGTGSVALAGILTGLRSMGAKLIDQRIVFLGAGAAAIGIADMIVAGMVEQGLTEEEARRRFWFVDSKGLVTWKRGGSMQEHKVPYCRDDPPVDTLLQVVDEIKPTILLGLSGQPNSFDEQIIKTMHKGCSTPIIFALSNPTNKAECTAEEAYKWTDGQAIFASGSPFQPVTLPDGRRFIPGQGNNMYIFPGVGLGAILGKLKYIPNSMFYYAAKTLSNMVTADDLASKTVYPKLIRIREISAAIAVSVLELSFQKGLACIAKPDNLKAFVERNMWAPEYARTELDPQVFALNCAGGSTTGAPNQMANNSFSFSDLDRFQGANF